MASAAAFGTAATAAKEYASYRPQKSSYWLTPPRHKLTKTLVSFSSSSSIPRFWPARREDDLFQTRSRIRTEAVRQLMGSLTTTDGLRFAIVSIFSCDFGRRRFRVLECFLPPVGNIGDCPPRRLRLDLSLWLRDVESQRETGGSRGRPGLKIDLEEIFIEEEEERRELIQLKQMKRSLVRWGLSDESIIVLFRPFAEQNGWVPGSFEIAAVAERLGKYHKYQAIWFIGAVV
ncbi:6,7-dimethyl-8-ribityllumazine synthase [Actinidia rufa]|uniref:6,7-dimethyl-8-ribityllumazine synthase n=1 Tax=Actinidia rufa TaxID=165716 RepID=A0A7J0DP11_9ERIC|nr:6,7-dimethyl-8-ribityllumazine synthase [Actinidia rufa]